MVKRIDFGSKDAASKTREQYDEHLSERDDARKTTVMLDDDAPSEVVQKLRSEAFVSQDADTDSAGMRDLSEDEKEKLKRVHSNFSWQDNGFEAMRVKGALQAKGVTDWRNYYEPGEGVSGAVKTLQSAKSRSAQSGAKVAMDDRRDPDDQVNQRRRQQQTKRVRGRQLDSAKEAAVLDGDSDAAEFIDEQQAIGNEVFNIRFSESESGVPQSSGSDLALLEQRNEQRSARARRVDNRRAANITRDPVTWASAPSQYDYPGIDTVDPQEKHNRRPEKARAVDERELAPPADSLREWARNPDQVDWPGVDTPSGLGLGGEDVDLPDGDLGRSADEQDAKDDALFQFGSDGMDLSEQDRIAARAAGFGVSAEPERLTESFGGETSAVADGSGPTVRKRGDGVSVVETDRPDRQVAPPESALQEQQAAVDSDPFDMSEGVLATDDQQTLGGERANDQARLAGGETGSVDSEVASRPSENSGGLLADERDSTGAGGDTEQAIPDAFAVAEGGQDTFGDFGDDDGGGY